MGMIAISDDVLRDLERHAVANHMSIDKQAETFLRVAIGQTVVNENIVTRWDRIAAMTPKAGLLQDSLVLLREDREQ